MLPVTSTSRKSSTNTSPTQIPRRNHAQNATPSTHARAQVIRDHASQSTILRDKMESSTLTQPAGPGRSIRVLDRPE